MTKIRWPKNGEQVKFQNGNEVLIGICNGEPFGEGNSLTHLPVHVPEGDKNMMVYAKNIIEWPDE